MSAPGEAERASAAQAIGAARRDAACIAPALGVVACARAMAKVACEAGRRFGITATAYWRGAP